MDIILTDMDDGVLHGIRQFPMNMARQFQTRPNGAFTQVTPVAGIRLDSLPISSSVLNRIKIEENGIYQEFYVVRHNSYNTTRTQVLRRYIHSERQWHSSNVNAYATCTLDAWFNGDYFNSLPADIRGQIAAVTIPYTPGNGNTTLSSISRKVFAVSATELGHTDQNLNAEGVALASAATLKIAMDSSGTAKVQWTRSPYTSRTTYAWSLYSNGSLYISDCPSTYGPRPSFTFPGDLLLHPTPDADGCYIPILGGAV